MTNSLKFPHHKLNSSQNDEFVNEKKLKKKSKNSNKKNKGRKNKNAHSTVPSNIPIDCKEQPVLVHSSENIPPKICVNNYIPRCNEQLPIAKPTKALEDQNRKDSENTDSSCEKKCLLDEANIIEINLPRNHNFSVRFHRIIKIDELGIITIKFIYPDKPDTYKVIYPESDNINQCNTSEIDQLPSIIPDYYVINLHGMKFPLLVYPNSDECGKPMAISTAPYSTYSPCSDYVVRAESEQISTSETSNSVSSNFIQSTGFPIQE
ncbi:2246_t:CDS:2 [Dentiscutata erythropus]|uniref:2246_t:CDS:1 n=1 Tax=Dentiscutata erythropus TaxID=1348616 RepID=A0A9N8WFI9_9GLOM|nr:2246_t:CDS:2 [Dentiscutata erythropus]